MPTNKHFFDPADMPDDDVDTSVVASEPSASDDEASDLLAGAAPTESRALESLFKDPPLFSGEDSLHTNRSLIEEAHDAVHELIAEPLMKDMVFPSLPVTDESPDVSLMPPPVSTNTGSLDLFQSIDSGISAAQIKAADELFSLILCDHPFSVLVEKILQIVMKGLDAQVGSILELDTEKNEFFFRAAIGGSPDQVKNFRVPANKGIVGHVAESRQILLINDMADDDKQLKSISIAVGFDAKSCLAAPVVIANQLYGVVEVFNKQGINYFDSHDKEVLENSIKWAAKVLEVRFFLSELVNKKVA